MRSGNRGELVRFLDSKIRRIPDFPKRGIIFYDISTLLKDSEAFYIAVDLLSSHVDEVVGKDSFSKVVGIESRGFIFASAIAYRFKKGLVMVRKEGKLPAETLSYSYGLEYGTATVEIHTDAIERGENVIIVDDLLATGGTALATCKLVEDLGGNVSAFSFLIELDNLGGRRKIEGIGKKVASIIRY